MCLGRRRPSRNSRKVSFPLFDPIYYADFENKDQISLWILKTVAGNSMYKHNNDNFENEEILNFLGLEKYLSNKDYTNNYVIELLKNRLMELECIDISKPQSQLELNILELSKLFKLNSDEQEVLRFFIYLKLHEILSDVARIVGDLDSKNLSNALSIIIDVPVNTLREIFESSTLVKASIIKVDKDFSRVLSDKVNFINRDFPEIMLTSTNIVEELLKQTVSKCSKSSLEVDDYEHVGGKLNNLLNYLKRVQKERYEGVNILIYGNAGTGKTELAKLIASELKSELYEINYADSNGAIIEAKTRLGYFKSAETLIKTKDNTILMYDEAEDAFRSELDDFNNKTHKSKAWINKVLETNKIPTIWISNYVGNIDEAILRRFDFIFELPIPKKETRAKIIKKHSNGELNQKTIDELANHKNISPALISSAISVAKKTALTNKNETIKEIINSTLKAQGYKELPKNSSSQQLQNYSLEYINTSTNLEELISGIDEICSARICIYGATGTGKSAFGKHIADKLGKPIIIKKASDILSMWVGENEQNIAKAFKEASDEEAVLVFDEIDSFLADRTKSRDNWEATLVNEMLVQMENFDGIFIATTNLIDNLDQASLRRFDLKMKFDYLLPNQAKKLFLKECSDLKFECEDFVSRKVENLDTLTVGDFAAVRRQNRFKKLKDSLDFYNRLTYEVEIKNVDNSPKLGFMR